jgi:predicted phosphoribosyltransferase
MDSAIPVFKDRKDAAVKLATAVRKCIEQIRAEQIHSSGNGQKSILAALSNPLVLGIPRGGVETAFWVAKQLQSEFSVIIARKLGYPHNPELAFGAISEEGAIYRIPDRLGILTREIVDSVREIEQKELDRRVKLYRNGEHLPELHGRFVILVDDGIATGATLLASLETLRMKHPKFLMIAVPVSSQSMKATLQTLVDSVVVLETPKEFHSVSQVYEHFESLSDHHVQRFIESFSDMQAVTEGD